MRGRPTAGRLGALWPLAKGPYYQRPPLSGRPMKKKPRAKESPRRTKAAMRPEYDFTKGVRGKYAHSPQARKPGHCPGPGRCRRIRRCEGSHSSLRTLIEVMPTRPARSSRLRCEASTARLKTCVKSSQRTALRLAPRSCSYTWGSADSWHHAPQVARRDQTPRGSRDSDIRRSACGPPSPTSSAGRLHARPVDLV
jgi:hypothetical protein